MVGFLIVYIFHRARKKPRFINIIWIAISAQILVFIVEFVVLMLNFNKLTVWGVTDFVSENEPISEEIIY